MCHNGVKHMAWQVGGGRVIAGFDAAVSGLEVGGTRTQQVPPEQGYGAPCQKATLPPLDHVMHCLSCIQAHAGAAKAGYGAVQCASWFCVSWFRIFRDLGTQGPD